VSIHIVYYNTGAWNKKHRIKKEEIHQKFFDAKLIFNPRKLKKNQQLSGIELAQCNTVREAIQKKIYLKHCQKRVWERLFINVAIKNSNI